MYTYIIIVKIL